MCGQRCAGRRVSSRGGAAHAALGVVGRLAHLQGARAAAAAQGVQQLATEARAGSNIAALRQTVAMTSCAQSSASAALAPDFIRKPFTRGAK